MGFLQKRTTKKCVHTITCVLVLLELLCSSAYMASSLIKLYFSSDGRVAVVNESPYIFIYKCTHVIGSKNQFFLFWTRLFKKFFKFHLKYFYNEIRIVLLNRFNKKKLGWNTHSYTFIRIGTMESHHHHPFGSWHFSTSSLIRSLSLSLSPSFLLFF